MQPRQLQAKPVFSAATKIRIGRGRSLPLRNQQAKPFSPASIRKSGPEIKNRCTQEGVNGEKHTSIRKFGLEIKNRCTHEGINRQNLAAIPKFTPSNQESLHARGRFWAKPCSDSHIHPMKSGIAATTTAIGGTSLLCDNGNKNRTRKIVAATPAAGETILLCRYEN